MWLLSQLEATLTMTMSWRSRGIFLLFSRWSSCSSGHISLVVGSTTRLIGSVRL